VNDHPDPNPNSVQDSRGLTAWDPKNPDATLSLRFSIPEDAVEPSGGIVLEKAYTLGTAVGRGGMAQIFSASDSVLDREVALKVNTLEDRSEDPVFLREARVLARLAHPNIVPIHDFGRDAAGRPFYSMKLVRGQTLKARVAEVSSGRTAVSTANLLLIFRKICDAVAFAHSRGFLHRDLKPENVMLGEYGEVLVMDWGLALQLDEKGQAPGVTPGDTALIEGTPQYMAPEQAEGGTLDVRSDVYALGALLDSILTRQLPVTGKSLEEILGKVRRGEVLEKDPQRKPAQIPGALRAVIAKATALAPAERYPDVLGLLADLDAYLAGFATEAEQAGLFRQILLLIRRHRIAAALAGVLFLSAASFTLSLAASQREAARNAEQAVAQSVLARENERTARQSAAEATLALAELAEKNGHGGEMSRALSRVPQGFRTQPWQYMHAKFDTAELTFPAPRPGKPWITCAVDPVAPHHLLALDEVGVVASLNLVDGSQNVLCTVPANGLWDLLSASPDGSRFVLLRAAPEPPISSRIEMYARDTGTLIWTFDAPFGRERPLTAATAFGADGSALLLSSLAGGGVIVLNAWTGALMWQAPEEERATAQFDKKSGEVLVYSNSRGHSRRDLWTGVVLYSQPERKFPRGDLSGPKVCYDAHRGKLFFQHRGAIQKMDARSLETSGVCPLPGGAHFLGDFVHLPERDVVTVLVRDSDSSSSIQFWQPTSGVLLREVVGPASRGNSPRWGVFATPVPGQVAVLQGQQIKTWTLPRVAPEWSGPVEPDNFFDTFAFLQAPDAAAAIYRRVVGTNWHTEIGVVDIRQPSPAELSGRSLSPNPNKNNTRATISTNRDGSLLAAVQYDAKRNQFVLRLFSGSRAETPGPELLLSDWSRGNAHLNPSGTRVWLGNAVWETTSGRLLPTNRTGIVQSADKARAPRWLDDSRVLEIAMVLESGTQIAPVQKRQILVWNAETGSQLASVEALAALCVAPAPDGRKFAEGGADRRIRIRDAQDLSIQKELRVHDGAVTAAAWHPHLPIVATSSEDRTVRLWHVETGEKLEEFGVFYRLPDRLYWNPAGTRLAVLSRDGRATLDIFRPACVANPQKPEDR
jgi:WD40 repeat protein